MRCPHCNHLILNSTSIVVEYNGEKLTLHDLSKVSGIAYTTIQNRYHRGLRGEELVTPPWKCPPERVVSAPAETSQLMNAFLSSPAP